MSRARPKIGLSVLPEDDLRLAQLPLFAGGRVEAIEWTLDAEFAGVQPDWIEGLLDHYASASALYAHGVQFSPLSASFEPRQAEWLRLAEQAEWIESRQQPPLTKPASGRNRTAS